jgi:tRNA1Val (adenine37-N6)-methyltransferase
MGADVFHFKNFSMTQAPSGQRVNTDSCVFGAVIGRNETPKRILDIGTGTGVLALMLAARFPLAKIVAVEPERDIIEVARRNVDASPWADRIELVELRAQDLYSAHLGRFDMVLCNPPYFQNSLLSENRLRMVARHNTDLQPVELYLAMKEMMAPQASAWLSFPEDSYALWIDCAQSQSLTLTHEITVADHPEAKPHMTIAGLSMNQSGLVDRSHIFYRDAHKGPSSSWMRGFREEWYPEKYNRNFY